MKLISTETGQNWIELTYADNADVDEAESFLVVRLPSEVRDEHSIALNRFVALKQLHNFIGQQMEADRQTSDQIR